MKKQTSSKKAVAALRYCGLPPVPPIQLPANISADRSRAIIANSKKLVNGTVLKYYFFKQDKPAWRGTAADMLTARNGFAAWKNLGIGLNFVEVNSAEEADIRIGFAPNDGSWSYVGRDIFTIPTDERTMNLGWNELDTAIHEIGHTIGLEHEHQNPFAGIVWNEEAVYADLGGPPNNWSRDKTFYNIIRKIPPSSVAGTTWDPNSVMHYPFSAGLIDQPTQYRNGLNPAGGLSASDKAWVRSVYPPLHPKKYPILKVGFAAVLKINNGDQMDYLFQPTISRKYSVQTTGEMDTILLIYEAATGENHYMAGDDNSGRGSNAKLLVRLVKNRKYIIRVRMIYRAPLISGAIIVS